MSLSFCNECANMLIPREDPVEKVLVMYCVRCQNTQPAESAKIYENTLYSTASNDYSVSLYGKEVVHDDTVPRTYTSEKGDNVVECEICGGHDAAYFTPSDATMKLRFVCCNTECNGGNPNMWWDCGIKTDEDQGTLAQILNVGSYDFDDQALDFVGLRIDIKKGVVLLDGTVSEEKATGSAGESEWKIDDLEKCTYPFTEEDFTAKGDNAAAFAERVHPRFMEYMRAHRDAPRYVVMNVSSGVSGDEDVLVLLTWLPEGGLKADMEIYNEARMKLWLKFDNERRKKITASTFAELELTSLMSAVYSE